MYRHILVLCIGMLSCIWSHAQENIVSLSKAIEKALHNYPGATGKQTEILVARYQEKIVQDRALPQANLQLQSAYGSYNGSNGAFFPQPGFFNVTGSPSSFTGDQTTSNMFGSVTADWTLFQFGRQRMENKAAGLAVTQADKKFEAYQLDLKIKVARLYLDVLYHSAKKAWSFKNADRVKQIYEIAVTLASSGLRPGADSLLAGASFTQLSSDVDHWQGKRLLGMYRLAAYMGDSIAPGQLGSAHYLTVGNVNEVEPKILAEHPYLSKLGAEVLYNKSLGQAFGLGAYPSVSLLGGLASRSNGIASDGYVSSGWADGFQNPANNYLVGIGLRWNLTGIHNSMLQRKKQYSTVRAVQAYYDEQSLQLTTNLKGLHASISEQLKQVYKSNVAVNQAMDAYDQYIVRYENGLMSLTELLQIQLLLQQAENVQLEAYRAYWDQETNLAELTNDLTLLTKNF